MNILSILLVMGTVLLPNCILAQSRVYDPGARLTASNTFYLSENTINDMSYGLMVNNSFNIGKEGAISIGLSYAAIGGDAYREISFVSFPITFHKYFNPQRNKINVGVTLNPGIDISNDSRFIMNFGYHAGYRFNELGNIGFVFEIFSEEVERARLMGLGVFYEYYFFRKSK